MDTAHKSWWQIFELVFGIPFLIAIALQWSAPLSLPPAFLTPVFMVASGVLVVAGLAIVVLARRELARYLQSTDPGHATTSLVTTGVFSFSRNPLYLGGVLVLVGIGFAFNLPWVLLLLLPSLVACQYLLIAPEETYLAAKFGQDYAAYAASVRRWFGRK